MDQYTKYFAGPTTMVMSDPICEECGRRSNCQAFSMFVPMFPGAKGQCLLQTSKEDLRYIHHRQDLHVVTKMNGFTWIYIQSWEKFLAL